MAMTDIVAAAWGMLWKYLPRWLALVPLIVAMTVVLQLAAPEAPERDEDASSTEIGLIAGLFALSIVANFVTSTVIVAGALALARGEPLRIGDAYRRGLRAAPAVALASLIMLLVVVPLAMLIVPFPLAIYFLVSWSLLIPVALADGGSPLAILRRSRAVVRGQWWRTFGIQASLILLATVLPLIVSNVVLGADADAVIIALMTGAIAAFSTPFQFAAQTLLYADLRARKGEPLPVAPRPTLT